MRDGVMGEGRSEYAIRPLPAIEQIATTSCTYYAELLVNG
jgi:hypothetical protein